MKISKNEKRQIIIYAIFIILLLVCAYFYIRWQFNLCYPDVSDSIWYCLQHALFGMNMKIRQPEISPLEVIVGIILFVITAFVIYLWVRVAF